MLSEQQKKFADLYITSGNAKQSYIDAGYKAKDNVAEAAASRLLRNVKVQEYIEEQNTTLKSERIADMEEVKEFWSKTMRNESIEFKDRLKASEYIAKTNAAFIEKKEIDANVNLSFEEQLQQLVDDES